MMTTIARVALLTGACLSLPAVPLAAQTSAAPERVIVNLTESPATSLAFNWRTDSGAMEAGFIEYAEGSSGPDFLRNVRRAPATRERSDFVDREGSRTQADYYSATLVGLQPDTEYMYRVGGEGAWSPWRQVRTAAKGAEPFTFLYLGDVQNDVRSLGGYAVRRAFRNTPDASFVLYAGDLINRGDSDAEWRDWFSMAPDLHAEVPSIMTPGNHEFFRYKDGEPKHLTPLWRHQFNLPTNGPAENVSETAYSVDYQGVRLISLDAEMADEVPESAGLQRDWLERQLADSPNRWTIVFLHYPLYSTAEGRDSDEIRELLQPVFERYNVDLVLQGHDHSYGRGRPSPEGPAYVVSVAGPKQYMLGDLAWADRKASGIQLFQQIEVTPSALTLRAYTVDGELYDAFRLEKPGAGPATMVDLAPDSPERIMKEKLRL